MPRKKQAVRAKVRRVFKVTAPRSPSAQRRYMRRFRKLNNSRYRARKSR